MSSTSTTPFLQYLNTNYVPSGNEIGQIQALVQDRQKLVDALDKEIDVLVKRREENSRFVKEHSALLSPVRRVPNEILSLIFLASLPRNSPTRRRTILSKHHPAVVVSHVCQRWRRVSLNTALLWTVIDIDIPRFPAPHESAVEGGVDWWEGQLQVINEMARAWISRSASYSLTISLTGGLNIQHPEFLEEEIVFRATESVARIADALCDVSDRWKAAHLSLEILNVISPPSRLLHLTFDDLIRLESLSVKVLINSPDMFQSPELQSNLGIASGGELVKAPYLRRLAIGRTWVPSMSLSVDWAALTELSLAIPSGQPDPAFPFPVLTACPNLTRCSLEFPPTGTFQLQTPDSEISLSNLHTFEIWGSEPPRIFASRLHLPSLRQLTLLCQPHYTQKEYVGGAIDLIQKFGDGLTDVIFDTRGFIESTLTRVLHLLPNIVSLRLVEGFQRHLSSFTTPIIFDSVLDELSRRDGENGSLCPKLERFGCQMTTQSVFSQAALVRFIASRRSGSHVQQRNRPTTEASLKSAVVAFTTRNPAKAARDVLEEMGVDLEGMTLITTYQREAIDSGSAMQVQMDDLYDSYDYASTVGQRRRTLGGWFL